MTAQPICIRRTTTMEEAEIIVAWLADNDIEATIGDRNNTGTFAFGVTDMEGIAILVADPQAAEKADSLLAEHDKERAAKFATMGPITAVCEDCGQSNQFPPTMAGSVQECNECRAFVDVPGGDD